MSSNSIWEMYITLELRALNYVRKDFQTIVLNLAFGQIILFHNHVHK